MVESIALYEVAGGSDINVSACDVTLEQSAETLEDLVVEFKTIAKVSDDYAIRAAFLVKRIETLVNQGAAGPSVTWLSWGVRLGLPTQRIQRYLRIAEDKNPVAKRDEFLRQDRERAKRCREKKKAQKHTDLFAMDSGSVAGRFRGRDRLWLTQWAKSAALPQVRRVRIAIEAGTVPNNLQKGYDDE